jgi:glycerol kinase
VGITQQRETTVVWNRHTGWPIYNAIVWQDTRTQAICDDLGGHVGEERFRQTTGLPLATYFSGPKVRWILDNVPGARAQAEAGDLLMGTIDTWLLWNLTGGRRPRHRPENASRTLMMDLDTLQWDPELVAAVGIPESMLPEIRSSSEVYGEVRSPGLDAWCPHRRHPR